MHGAVPYAKCRISLATTVVVRIRNIFNIQIVGGIANLGK